MAKNTQTEEAQGLDTEMGEGFTFDMNTVVEDEGGLEPMPQGTYNCTIEEAEYKLSASSGQPMWSLKLAVSEGEWAEKNRKLFTFVSFKPDQLGRAKALIAKFASDLISLPNFNPKTIADEGVLVGRPIRVKVKIGSYEGKKRNEVKEILAPGVGEAGGGGFAL